MPDSRTLRIDTWMTHIGTLVTCDPTRSSADNPLGILRDAVLGLADGRVAFVGTHAEAAALARDERTPVIDAQGGVVTPGLIDSHTHAVYGGSREGEFARRLEGVPYMRIAAEGGGINATVRATRAASEDELFTRAACWLDEMRRFGVTTVEVKSGYGLDTENELKQLRAIRRLGACGQGTVVPTFMGAHDFPPEFRDDHAGYVSLLVEEMLPAVAEARLARFADVFCEEGVFTPTETRRLLTRAKDLGFLLRLHADEFVDTHGAELAAELGCVSADHLMAVNDTGIRRLAEAGVAAGLLPATTYTLGSGRYAPARRLLEAGVRVVLASDFNPGSCTCSNLPLVMNMGCTQMRMRVPEVILAVTRSAAHSLGLAERKGQLCEGFDADLVLWDMPSPDYLVYHLGRSHAFAVYVGGRLADLSPYPPVFLARR